jgi:uncharacterized protein (TIGR03790 family)
MKNFATLFLLVSFLVSPLIAKPQQISPNTVAIIYNKNLPESEKLAKAYQEARSIPEANLVGLELPDVEEITRSQYNELIAAPLKKIFDERNWWKRGRSQEGIIIAVENQIRIMVCMRGVPLKIARFVEGKPPVVDPKKPANPAALINEAAVDSELAYLSVEKYPLDGLSKNHYYQSEQSITESNFPFLLLIGRIDAPTFPLCYQLIKDAAAAEKTGLWGKAYVDLANKFPKGDAWLKTVATDSKAAGFPTVINSNNEVFLSNYPMNDAAIYFGWYAENVCGPFLNPNFKFKLGAVAVHLHSFSAVSLRDPKKYWSAPLLSLGAAATIGNVYEPFLGYTHHLDIFQNRLLAGYTLVEAAYAAIPVVSWQGVVIGDPLYRPFLHLDLSGEKNDIDRSYRALRAARINNPNDENKRLSEIERIGKEKKNAVFLENLGLEYLTQSKKAEAVLYFHEAKLLYQTPADQLRNDLHIIEIDRNNGKKDLAIEGLRKAAITYKVIPEASCIQELMAIINPPPPPEKIENKK